ncbi:hypothetical protein M0Q97_11610 [Candidatus Dojkabacteria bacterium]|jgi:hypothetical protein|nr:hypothetical protein [Candidatus Dojkabacteria bacterium]
MNISINNFIDFKGIFDALIEEQKEDLEQYKYESDNYHKILDFINSGYSECEILSEDCELKDNRIVFAFIFNYNNANESNNQSDTELYIIEFDCLLNEFDAFYWEGC